MSNHLFWINFILFVSLHWLCIYFTQIINHTPLATDNTPSHCVSCMFLCIFGVCHMQRPEHHVECVQWLGMRLHYCCITHALLRGFTNALCCVVADGGDCASRGWNFQTQSTSCVFEAVREQIHCTRLSGVRTLPLGLGRTLLEDNVFFRTAQLPCGMR